MFASFRRRSLPIARHSAALVGLVAFVAGGCGPKTAKQGLDQAFKDNPKSLPVQVTHYEGTVTVDGKPPATPNTVLLVILNDMKHLQDPAKKPKLMTGCDESGHFSFSTYEAHDGVQSGSYVVTFVELHSRPSLGRERNAVFPGPDELKNLYNDPEKNAEISEFKVDIQPPGTKDAHFNLVVEGKEPVTTPGPHAITGLDTR
jgi:hypothetical protein